MPQTDKQTNKLSKLQTH